MLTKPAFGREFDRVVDNVADRLDQQVAIAEHDWRRGNVERQRIVLSSAIGW
ncbi:MAG: hypothetical protein WDN69_16655 [Aliidongia sp.]